MLSPPPLRWRLSLLMFLQYAVPGAVLPLYSLRLEQLGFTPREIAWGCSTQALASLTAPLFVGQLADRWFHAERCLAVCAAVAGVVLWLLAGLTTPGAVFTASLASWLAIAPMITLGTALSFAHLPLAASDFGRVRLWGTVGWVASGWALGYWFREPYWLSDLTDWLRPGGPRSELPDVFRLASLLSVALAGYALTLPRTPPRLKHAAGQLAPVAALRLLQGRPFAVYAFCLYGVCLTLPFTTQVTPLLLAALEIPRTWLFPTLTISQSTEIASLAMLAMILLSLGLRRTMLLGLLAWAGALATLTLGSPFWLVVSCLSLNGLCICCFVVAGQVFVNSRARGDVRASAQALLTFISALGLLSGNLLVGEVRRWADGRFRPTFAVGALIACVLTLTFLFGFRGEGVTLDAGSIDQE